jgi:NitT/TauT family transport system substrate-binding protein
LNLNHRLRAARTAAFCLAITLVLSTTPASAEVREIRLARQSGLGYLPLMVMESEKLIEKRAKSRGLGDVDVKWTTFAAGNVMNDALLSGSLDIASGGPPPMITLWAKSNGDVRGIAAMTSMQIYVNTRDPNVRAVKDFSDRNRIALPAVKVSVNAIVLQMAAEQAFGPGNYAKLDPITVSLGYPDSNVALMSGTGEIDSAFTTPPYYYRQLQKPGIHTALKSYEVLGGPATNNVMWTTRRFHDENPGAYGAVLDAFEDAIAFIYKNPRRAAEIYQAIAHDTSVSVDDLVPMLNDPAMQYTTTPQNVTKYSDFMFRLGSIKSKPASWKDLFFENIHDKPGS